MYTRRSSQRISSENLSPLGADASEGRRSEISGDKIFSVKSSGWLLISLQGCRYDFYIYNCNELTNQIVFENKIHLMISFIFDWRLYSNLLILKFEVINLNSFLVEAGKFSFVIIFALKKERHERKVRQVTGWAIVSISRKICKTLSANSWLVEQKSLFLYCLGFFIDRLENKASLELDK